MKAGNEVRVGVVVLLALALMMAGYFFLRGVGLGADNYYILLNGATPISEGSPVRLQGVKVGVVQNVSLDPATQRPLLKLAIRRNPPYRLLRSYKYTVQSQGIIGENYVDIRGTFVASAPDYTPNDTSQVIPARAVDTLLGGLQTEASDIVGDFRTTLGKFNVTLERINKGILSYQNQVKLARTLDGVSRLTTRAESAFGPRGFRFEPGDPQTRNGINSLLAATNSTAREAGLTARELRRQVQVLGGQARGTLGNVDATVGENRVALRGLLDNLDRTTRNIAGLTETLDFAFREGGFRENAALAFTSLRRAAENVEGATTAFGAVGRDPKTQAQLNGTLVAVRETTESLRDTARAVSGLLGDPESQAKLKNIFGTLNEATANLRDVTEGFKNIVTDSKVQDDLKALPAELRGTLEATRGAAEKLENLLPGRRRTRRAAADSTPAANGTPSPEGTRPNSDEREARRERRGVPTGVNVTYRSLTDLSERERDQIDGRNFGDVTLNTDIFGGPFRLGLSGIGEGSDLTLQAGQYLGENGALRYGLYRSKLGFGADYQLGRFSLEGNFYDPNERSLNAYVGYKVSPKIEIIVGREHVGNVRTNALGVRLRP